MKYFANLFGFSYVSIFGLSKLRIFSVTLVCICFIFSVAEAKLKVVATVPDIGSMLEMIGGDQIELDVIAKGTQDPHFLEAKPSYMVKLSRADLLVSIGLSLESGWLPSLIQGSRNPKINIGSKGNLELGRFAEPLDVAKGAVSRADGDVHPEGNPHFVLDPIRVGKLALLIAERLGELDEANRTIFSNRAKDLQKMLVDKTKNWQERVVKTGLKKIITYHNDMVYFLERFGLESAGYLEPKPGIPPSAQHILSVINTLKTQKIKVVLVENYFDTKIADRLQGEVPEVKIKVVGIGVGSKPELKSIMDVIEQLVSALESDGKGSGKN